MDESEHSNRVIGAAIGVHRQIGPGHLERIYQRCLGYELRQRGMSVQSQWTLPVRYEELELAGGMRVDLLVESRLVVELKAVDTMLPVFSSQVLSCLGMRGLGLGLLINFKVPHLRNGIKRVVNNFR